MSNSPHILLVDDDHSLCALLSEYLQGENFCCSSVHDGQAAIESCKEHEFDALVLDIMMPGISGLEALQQIRKNHQVPVIMLTGRGDDIDKIVGLEMGADDYMSKPCNPRELSARIKAVLRRSQPSSTENTKHLNLHGIELSPDAFQVTVNQQTLNLTTAEFNVLKLLMSNAGQTLSKEYLTEQVLNRALTPYDRSIDVHVSRVRQKLLQQGGLEDLIKTIRGAGYQLVTEQ